MNEKEYLDSLIDRDTVLQPYADYDCTDQNGEPLVRCRNCEYVLMGIERFCPVCGQRLYDEDSERQQKLLDYSVRRGTSRKRDLGREIVSQGYSNQISKTGKEIMKRMENQK